MITISKLILAFSFIGITFYITVFTSNVNSQIRNQQVRPPVMQVNIENWPEASKKAAKMLIDKYGEPDESTLNRIIWSNNGSWKRTIVYKKEVLHSFPKQHGDVIEQFIDYKMPIDKSDELLAFNGSVIYKRTEGEILAKCESEAANYLALNLANEIVTGQKNVEEARIFYGKTMKEMEAGRSSEYVEKLLFVVEKGKTADPDRQLDTISVTE